MYTIYHMKARKVLHNYDFYGLKLYFKCMPSFKENPHFFLLLFQVSYYAKKICK